MLELIKAGLLAVAAWFGYRQKVSATPSESEIQAVRKERDEEIKYNADAVKYGVDPVTGRVRYPASDK